MAGAIKWSGKYFCSFGEYVDGEQKWFKKVQTRLRVLWTRRGRMQGYEDMYRLCIVLYFDGYVDRERRDFEEMGMYCKYV